VVLVFSRPIRGSIDCLDFRGLGTLEGVVAEDANVPANGPLPDPLPLLLRFIETGPSVVRRGFGGRGMVHVKKEAKMRTTSTPKASFHVHNDHNEK
jgi:hypothetical protein